MFLHLFQEVSVTFLVGRIEDSSHFSVFAWLSYSLSHPSTSAGCLASIWGHFFSFNTYQLFLCSAACHLPNHQWANAQLRLLWDERWPWYDDERTFSGWLHLVFCSTSVIELLTLEKKKKKLAKQFLSQVALLRRFGECKIWDHVSLCAHCRHSNADIPPLWDALQWNFLLISQELRIRQAFVSMCSGLFFKCLIENSPKH